MVSGGKICKKYLRIDEADQKDDLWSLFLSHIQSLLLMKPCTTFCSDHLINKQTGLQNRDISLQGLTKNSEIVTVIFSFNLTS